MRAPIVLVTFANQAGSTAWVAEIIAGELRAAGIVADCRPVSEVTSLAPYDALVLGSGLFVPRRRSDGMGFLSSHAEQVAGMPVWLFCAGPIGRGHAADGLPAGECPVTTVARTIGARGACSFGSLARAAGDAAGEDDPMERVVDPGRVRAWAQGIAGALLTGGVPVPR